MNSEVVPDIVKHMKHLIYQDKVDEKLNSVILQGISVFEWSEAEIYNCGWYEDLLWRERKEEAGPAINGPNSWLHSL